jgi:hypothetical protein
MTYQLLALDKNSRYMSLPVLRKIREMVYAGAIVSGNKPVSTPSLSDDPAEFQSLVNELWANEKGENVVGKGKVFAGQSLQEVMTTLGITPDFAYTKPQENTNLLYVHRQFGKVDFYWINNRQERVEEVEATFRVEGREAEIWHAETGKIEQVSYAISNGVTKVPLHLKANDAVFVVFRNKAKAASMTIQRPIEQQLAVIEGPWNVNFQEKRGPQAQVVFESLTPWNDNSDQGVKYFSGTGTYIRTIEAPDGWFREGAQLWIDLGSVKNLAEVIVNGKSLGIVWETPFRVNATEALKQGENQLEIKVTNLWVNRLIGDQQPGVTKLTFTTMPFYRADSPLLPSGLLGPVTIIGVTNQ